MEVEIVAGGQSQRHTLEDGEHTVGRGSDNSVVIAAPRVSKKHAVLRVDGDRMFVRDLESSNGTEINGKPIGSEELEILSGSLVSFAGALMRRADGLATGRHALFEDKHIATSMRYNLDQGMSTAARDRLIDNSSALFELLASGDESSEVGSTACRFVSGCVDADRVVLLEDNGEGTSVESRARWTRLGPSDAPLQLSTSIVSSVVTGRESILVSDAMDDARFGAQQSIMALNLRSAMAVPLFDNERVRGILYVDTTNPGVKYGEDDLAVLTAVANAVAIKLRNISFEREMRTAANIQHSMLPDTLDTPDGYELDAYQDMCRAVGGDLYNCVRRENGNVVLVLGDVSGKGAPAALAMSAAMVLIGVLVEIEGDLLTLVERIHRQLFRSLAPEQFITMFIAELHPETGHVDYVNAGHDMPLILHDDGTLDQLEPTGMPVAMVDDPMLTASETTLAPGDLLVIFSDGIPEATTTGDTFLGLDSLKNEIRTRQNDPLPDLRKRIVKSVHDFLDGQPASDDVTLVLLRRKS